MSFSDLPRIHDLLNADTCKISHHKSACTCFNAVTKKSKPPVIDKRLRNWNEWMQRRKEMHQRLGQLLKRTPGSLVMNSSEELRTVKERKLAFEYAKIPEPDPQRGCPGFWKLPMALKDACGKEVYFSAERKEDRCDIPVIEHVGLPHQILKEKDVLPRTRNPQEAWEKSAYVQDKSLKLSYEMNRVDPYTPNFEDLFIKGALLSNSEEKSTVVTLTPTKSARKEAAIKSENPSILSLWVDDFQLGPNLDISGIRKVYVFFDYDPTTKKVATKYLTIKNQGSTTIRFYWKVSEKVELFKDMIPDRSHEIYFYFNKNEDLIIPGQTIQFPVWFKTDEPGTYCEQWEFCTKPKVMPANARLIIVLHASVEMGDMNKKVEAIREQLDKNVRDRLIKESLSAVLSDIPYDNFKPTVYCYNKKEVFETINSKFDSLHRQPKYLYSKDIVRELQQFYKNVRQPSDPKCWNYNIEELKILTRAKQRKEDQSERLAQQEEAKRIFEKRPIFPTLACEKTVFAEFDDVKQHTNLAKTNEKDQKLSANQKQEIQIDKKSLSEKLEAIISKLERPAVEKNLEQIKYTQAYLILCTCFSKINGEFEDLKDRLGIIKITTYPRFTYDQLPNKPSRLVQERLCDILQGPLLTAQIGTKMDKPAAEAIQGIPVEDCKRRYRTYYNLPNTPPPETAKGKKGKGDKKADKKKGGKDSKKGGKDSKKGGKDDKKSGKDKKGAKDKKEDKKEESAEEDDGYVVNEDFDPYAERKYSVIDNALDNEEDNENEENIQSNIVTLPPAVLRQYKYNLYVIMYNNLDKAITNIVDMIEMQPKENLPYAVIKEFEEPKYTRRLIDLKSLLVEETAQQLKAKLLLYKYRKESKKDWRTIEIQRQLRSVRSDSSLWSLLRPYEAKPQLPEEKPISYPLEHYDDVRKVWIKTHDESKLEDLKSKKEEESEDSESKEPKQEPPLMLNISTSTLEGGVLDPTWEDFKDVTTQKDYGEEEEPDDLQAYIEKVISEISTQDLIDVKVKKSTQKETDDHVSDEEYFYDSESDVGTVTLLSVDSEQNEESCTACSVSVEEKCSCEGFGVCNLLLEDMYEEEYNNEEDYYAFVTPFTDMGENKFEAGSISAEKICTCDFFGECNIPMKKSCNLCGIGADEENSAFTTRSDFAKKEFATFAASAEEPEEQSGAFATSVQAKCSCEFFGECNIPMKKVCRICGIREKEHDPFTSTFENIKEEISEVSTSVVGKCSCEFFGECNILSLKKKCGGCIMDKKDGVP